VGRHKGRRRFHRPDEASNALVTAAQKTTKKPMLDVLGLDGKQIVSSGDEIEDAQNRANFVQRYKKCTVWLKNRMELYVLYIGAKNWPTPIPLVNKGSSWYFAPMQARKRFCLDELAGMKYRPFVFAGTRGGGKGISLRRARRVCPEISFC